MSDEQDMHSRIELAQVAQVLGQRGLAAGSAGNLSIRQDDGWILTTPSGRIKSRLSPKEMVEIALDGSPRDTDAPSASSEVRMHLAIYQRRPDVRAIVHAHPKAATAISLLGRPWPNLCVTAEGAAAFGPVGVVPYIRPGGWPLGEACAKRAAQGASTLILLNHGAVTMAQSLEAALAMMDALEHVCQLWLMARSACGVAPPTLDDEEARALRAAYGYDPTLPLAWFEDLD